MFKETIPIKKKKSVTTRTGSEMLAFLEDVAKERKKCSSNEKACINLGYSYDTFKNYKKKQNSKEGLVDKRRTKGITEEHKELLAAIICLWPFISLDAYFKLLKLRFPKGINRTRLYNFLYDQDMSEKKDRIGRVKEFFGGTLPVKEDEKEGKSTLRWIHTTLDVKTKVDKRRWEIQQRIKKEQKNFWKDDFGKSLLNKENDYLGDHNILNYMDIFLKKDGKERVVEEELKETIKTPIKKSEVVLPDKEKLVKGVINQKHIDMISANLDSVSSNSEDFVLFKSILERLSSLPGITEKNAYILVFISLLQEKGLTHKKLLSSINFYIDAIKKIKEDFDKAQSIEYEEKVTSIEKEISQLNIENEKHAARIEFLKNRIKTNNIAITKKRK
jgi:vacuolar-type H+-ATPase subunit I/STV1